MNLGRKHDSQLDRDAFYWFFFVKKIKKITSFSCLVALHMHGAYILVKLSSPLQKAKQFAVLKC
jgi:hypothetical protein